MGVCQDDHNHIGLLTTAADYHMLEMQACSAIAMYTHCHNRQYL